MAGKREWLRETAQGHEGFMTLNRTEAEYSRLSNLKRNLKSRISGIKSSDFRSFIHQ
jgi:hypothetical protein